MLLFNNMARSKQLQRLEPWHHDLIDWMFQNPAASGREAAAQFGVSAVWISIVKNSSVFCTEFERRREMISQAVATDIIGRATALASAWARKVIADSSFFLFAVMSRNF